MTNDIKKFEPTDYVEKLRERIRGALFELIPEEQWDRFIRAEVDNFFVGKDSHFAQIARGVLAEDAKKRVQAMLCSDEWNLHWSSEGQQQVAGEKIFEFLKRHGQDVLNTFLSGMFQNALNYMRNNRLY